MHFVSPPAIPPQIGISPSPPPSPPPSPAMPSGFNILDNYAARLTTYRLPTAEEAAQIETLAATIEALPADADAEAVQSAVYATGKDAGYENLRAWFQCLYEVLLGQSEGPRMGSFFALYGRARSVALMRAALAGELAAGSADSGDAA